VPRYKLILTMQCNAQMKNSNRSTNLLGAPQSTHTSFPSIFFIDCISWPLAEELLLPLDWKQNQENRFSSPMIVNSVVKCAAFYGINETEQDVNRTISRCNIVRRNWINKWKQINIDLPLRGIRIECFTRIKPEERTSNQEFFIFIPKPGTRAQFVISPS